jgi:hypothetical protein
MKQSGSAVLEAALVWLDLVHDTNPRPHGGVSDPVKLDWMETKISNPGDTLPLGGPMSSDRMAVTSVFALRESGNQFRAVAFDLLTAIGQIILQARSRPERRPRC